MPVQPTANRGLAHFNTLSQEDAERALRGCCRSHSWAHRVAAHRPYPDLDALLAASDEAAYDLTPADIAEALAGEELALPGAGAYAAASTALTAAHAAYQARFGHPFVICLDDVAADESLDRLLDGLRTRLGNDPVHERDLAAEELRRLARGRLARLTHHGISREQDRETGINSPYVPV
ncbi:2-oxo-4-hydroxy-4-carboxy-5-ureidoimidazoline decarboxylase [Streptomyces sp. WG-D5]